MDERRLAYCERVTATVTSPVHIRPVGDEGLKLGGGAPDTTLCGAPLHLGWDLEAAVASTLDRHATIPQDQPGRLCLTCVQEVSESLVDFLAAGLCAYNRHRRDQHQVARDLLTLLAKHPGMRAAVTTQLTAQDVPHVAAQVRAEVYRQFRHERAHRPGDEFAWCIDCTDDFRAPWPCAWERHLDNLERQLHGDPVDQLECGAAPN